MQLAPQSVVDPNTVLAKSVSNAARIMGLTRQELGVAIGRDRTSINRGLDPDSKPGELALLLVRCYRALAVLVGQNPRTIKHWFNTYNHHTGGVPRQQVQSVQGLVRVTEYLDAMRGKL